MAEIESIRQVFEEIDRTRAAAAREMAVVGRTQRERVHAEHMVSQMVDRIVAKSSELSEYFQDESGSRAAELSAIAGPDEFSEFYARLKDVRERHRVGGNEIAEPMTVNYVSVEDSINGELTGQAYVKFSGEEGHGTFLDLHPLYEMYLNLRCVEEKIDYTEYLSSFDQLSDIPVKAKKNGGYRRYVEALLSYLVDFRRRTTPLVNVDAELAEVKAQFAEAWAGGKFPGWSGAEGSAQTSVNVPTPQELDLSTVQSASELIDLGMDRLKSALMALGLKCGGTVEQRAQRLLSVKDVPKDKWPKKILASKSGTGTAAKVDTGRSVAELEAQVMHTAKVLAQVRLLTRENVERKQARQYDEMEDEEEVADIIVDEDEEDEDEDIVPYNPKDLPLGWDGKPIPYWLYKLHGLNMRYSCEICGDVTYRGPKAFQQHFREWRHAHGMRCLGIPNTAHFQGITLINDALALWDRLKEEKQSGIFQAAEEEEYEDSQGNVVNKKTYEDLKRQGLL